MVESSPGSQAGWSRSAGDKLLGPSVEDFHEYMTKRQFSPRRGSPEHRVSVSVFYLWAQFAFGL